MANKYLNDTGLTYFFNRIKTLFLTNVAYDSSTNKITKTINGTTTDVVDLSSVWSGLTVSIVNSLPSTGEEDTLYLVPKTITTNMLKQYIAKITPNSSSGYITGITGTSINVNSSSSGKKINFLCTLDSGYSTSDFTFVLDGTTITPTYKSNYYYSTTDLITDASDYATEHTLVVTNTTTSEELTFVASVLSYVYAYHNLGYATYDSWYTDYTKDRYDEYIWNSTDSNFERINVKEENIYEAIDTLIADKADASSVVTDVNYDSTNQKLTKTINGSTSDVFTFASALNASQAITDIEYDATNRKFTIVQAGTESDLITLDALKGYLYSPFFAVCSTAAATAAKVATITPANSYYVQTEGDLVAVYFENGNSNTGTVTLNVNSKGAHNTQYNSTQSLPTCSAGETVWFVYYQGYWQVIEDPRMSSKADLASPALTGTPTAPTAAAGKNTDQIATTAFVTTAITNALSGISGISFSVVTELPSTGTVGVIYLIAHSHGTNDIYDEYVWTGSVFEKLGNTDIDLSGYMLTTDMTAITTAEIDTLFS